MRGKRIGGKTVGEVERLTGIPKRQLKYFIERGLMTPSQRSESGYWLYSWEDIQKVRFIALCINLDFPARAIRLLLTDPAFPWREMLERQIVSLSQRRNRVERQLELARMLRDSCQEEPAPNFTSVLDRRRDDLPEKHPEKGGNDP